MWERRPSSPRPLPRHQLDQVLTSLPPTCERAKVNCAYLHLRCVKCAMVQPQGVQVQMWAGSMNYPASTLLLANYPAGAELP